MQPSNQPLQINLRRIIHERAPGILGKLPPVLFAPLERLIRQRELNGILARTYPAEGVAFADAALRDLDISVEVRGRENLPASGRYIFASNHPLGGLDGIALISVLGNIYGHDAIRFPVNDLLMNVQPLRSIFVPINKFGRQGRQAAQSLSEVYASHRQVLYFPAGLVSRLGSGGRIADLEWKKTFVSKALETGRGIVPVFFSGINTMRFYRVARLRQRLGLRVNIEQALLPSELVKARGSRFAVSFGKPISHESLRNSSLTPTQMAAHIKEIVYNLPNISCE